MRQARLTLHGLTNIFIFTVCLSRDPRLLFFSLYKKLNSKDLNSNIQEHTEKKGKDYNFLKKVLLSIIFRLTSIKIRKKAKSKSQI